MDDIGIPPPRDDCELDDGEGEEEVGSCRLD